MSNDLLLVDLVKKLVKERRHLITAKWRVVMKDRGHFHYDYAIATIRKKLLVIECPSLEVAEHLVKVHNESLK